MKNIPKTYFDETHDGIDSAYNSINYLIEEGSMKPEEMGEAMDRALFTLLLYDIAHVADELHMLREAIEKKEGLADK